MSKKIFFVYAPAGPPLDYCMPKIARRAQVTTCIVTSPSDYNRRILEAYSKELIDLSDYPAHAVFKVIRQHIIASHADAVLTFSEFILSEVSAIANELGLRGAGPNVEYARNKILMRRRWQQAGLPQPRFVTVEKESDFDTVRNTLNAPYIIKVAYGAGSIGQQVITQHQELERAIVKLLASVEKARHSGKHEHRELRGFPKVIAEEIIQSTTDSWYDINGYGDYLSVEGIVRNGQYHPIAMTGRLPTIEPFTELCNLAPCILSADKKQSIVALATRAIDTLQLENAATHTEFKLMADGQVCLLETSARMGGVVIARELEVAFGVDYVDLFIATLLGDKVEIPAFEAHPTGQAAASVAMIASDTRGNSWPGDYVFNPDQVDWQTLTDGAAQVQIQWAQSLAPGSDFPPYNKADGVMNYAGQAFVVCPSPLELKHSVYQILDNLHQHMPRKHA